MHESKSACLLVPALPAVQNRCFIITVLNVFGAVWSVFEKSKKMDFLLYFENVISKWLKFF